MSVKSKKDSFKEKVNKKSSHSRVKYSKAQRLKDVKKAKKSKNIKFISKKLYNKCRKYENSIKQENSHIRTQTLIKNTSANVKDIFREKDENRQSDTGIQAVLYTSDKIDTVADVIYTSKKVIRAIKDTKNIAETVKGKSSINKKLLIKQLTIKGTKSGLRTAKNINTQVSNQFQSEDTDLGIRSFAEAGKEIRKTYDTAVAVKHTTSDITSVIKTVNSRKTKGNEPFKSKIYENKTRRYNKYKENIQNDMKTQSVKKVKAGSVNKTSLYRSNKIKTNRTTINRTVDKRSQVMISKISKNILETAKKTIIFILPGKKTMLLILICIVAFFLYISSLSSSLIAALSQQYFMTDNDIAEKYRDKVELLDYELKQEISDLAEDDSYDDVDIIYIGDMQGIHTNFQEIFAIATVKFEQDLTFSVKEEELIKMIYEEMYDIKISSEIYYVTDKDGKEVSKIRKIITVYTNDMEFIMNNLKFDNEQKSWTRRLVSNFTEQFPYLAQQYGELGQEEINNLIQNAPEFSSRQQEELYETALSIVGKVKYFWGGKSSVGWNNKWGELTLVTSPGNETTGEYIPFGLDCSGYVDWVYKTAGIGNMLSRGGTSYQWGQSYPISNDELQIGDLAFLQMPNSSGINHVGIYIGKDDENNNLYAHCQWGTGVTVDGYKGFKYFRRVVKFD